MGVAGTFGAGLAEGAEDETGGAVSDAPDAAGGAVVDAPAPVEETGGAALTGDVEGADEAGGVGLGPAGAGSADADAATQ